jgi:hypothetical protein
MMFTFKNKIILILHVTIASAPQINIYSGCGL